MGAATEKARLPRFSSVLGIESCCEVDDLSCLGIYNPDTNPAPKLTIHPSQRSTINKFANARSSKHFVYFIKKCDLKLVDKYLLIIAISNSMFCDL